MSTHGNGAGLTSIKSGHGIIEGLVAAAVVGALVVLLVFQGSLPVCGAEATKASQETATASKSAGGGSDLDLSSRLPRWMSEEVLGLPDFWRFVIAFVFILLGLVLKKVSDFAFEKRVIPLLERTRFAFDNLLASAASKPVGFLFLLGGIWGAFAVLPLPERPNVGAFVFGALKVLLIGDVLWFLFRSVDVGVGYLAKLAKRTESRLDEQLVPLIRKALKVTIGIVCFLWVIQNLGFSVSSLIAGLGIGGLAVALAFQDTLGNFFGSIFILLDRPFMVGDWIKVGDVEGIVEDIGFRSTRIRTWPKTVVSIPNKTIASSTIDNWSKMPKRRVQQTVGVTYETTPGQMEEALAAIREIIQNDEGVDKEYMVVRFTEFGDSSLNILVYYFTRGVALADHLATKERINLGIMRAVEKLGLSIAFPTRTVYFEGQIAKEMAQRLGDGVVKRSTEAKRGSAPGRGRGDRGSEGNV